MGRDHWACPIDHRTHEIDHRNIGRMSDTGSEETHEQNELERPKNPVMRHEVSWQTVGKRYDLSWLMAL